MSANTGKDYRLRAIARITDLTLQSTEAITKGNRDQKSIDSFLVMLQHLKDDDINKLNRLQDRIHALLDPFRGTCHLGSALTIFLWLLQYEVQQRQVTPHGEDEIRYADELSEILGVVASIVECTSAGRSPNGVYLSDTLRIGISQLARSFEKELPRFLEREDQASQDRGKPRLRDL
jgi:hypothetical protein